MKIKANVYAEILEHTPRLPPETGGILGGRDGVIMHCFLDWGISIEPTHYQPDTVMLQQIIAEWQSIGIDFYGIYHSHYFRDIALSPQDQVYIHQILNAMPHDSSSLYFPIVLPGKDIIAYRASRGNGNIQIACETIEII